MVRTADPTGKRRDGENVKKLECGNVTTRLPGAPFFAKRRVGDGFLPTRLSGMLTGAVLLAALLTTGGVALGQDVAEVVQSPPVEAAAPGGPLEIVVFYIVAGFTIVSAIGVCVSSNVVRMAVWLFCALGGVALLYLLLAANFLAAIQLIVYAGGTLILLVFGVMLTSKSPWAKFEISRGELLAAGGTCLAFFVALCFVYANASWSTLTTATPGAAIKDIGRSLITEYLVPFEAAGVLLMIVMVGAAHLARQEKR